MLLKAKGVGVDVCGVRVCATQFADDTQVLLPSLREVPTFLGAMGTFAAASGQQLNASKTKLLLLGRAARAQVDALQQQQQQRCPGGPQVVADAAVLGVPFGQEDQGVPGGSTAFQRRLPGVLAALRRLSHIKQLSAFGRGLGSAAYGVSQLLYAAEFDDAPTVAQCQGLATAVAAVVDRGVALMRAAMCLLA